MANKRKRFGKLPPQHKYSLNPYPELRMTSCIQCGTKTGQRKLPLVIYIAPAHFIALNYTHRYCGRCNMLIGHKHEIEHLLTDLFSPTHPEVVGNEYLIIGTAEKKAWREGLEQSKPIHEMQQHIHDFKRYEELRVTMGGWFMADQEPPVATPPPSTEWVKR